MGAHWNMLLCLLLAVPFFGCSQEEKESTKSEIPLVSSKGSVVPVQELSLPEVLPEALRSQKSLQLFPKNDLPKLVASAQARLMNETKLEISYHNVDKKIPQEKKATQSKPSTQKKETTKKDAKKSSKKKHQILNYDLLLAVTHPKHNDIKVIKVSFLSTAKETQKEARSHEGGFEIVWEVRNGCNTPFEISKPKGYAVLALRCLIGAKSANPESLVYTPYNDFLNTEEFRKEGYRYLMENLDKARKELQQKRVMSQAFSRELAADVVPRSIAFRLALIEHIEPSLINKVPTEALVNKVLVTIATNKESAYLASMSEKGAYGLFQFMPATYKTIVSRYPKAGLIPDFKEGMRDHLNAAKATLLLFDDDLTTLCIKFSKAGCVQVRNHPKSLAEYLAAAYNGSSGKVVQAIRDRKENESWKNGLFPETVMYLEKLEAVNKVLQ